MSIRDVITFYARGLITLTVLGVYLSHDVDTACLSKYYGPNCAVTCISKCYYPSYCLSNGRCHDSWCQSGWSGTTCQRGNIARDKPVILSTTLDTYWGAGKAVDGSTSGGWEDCAHTDNGDTSPRLRVDLKQQSTVYAMRFRNRDTNKYRMNNFEVYVTNTSSYDDRRLCYRRTKSVEHLTWVDFTCNQHMAARYVWVLSTKDYLTICEMEIFECSDFTFGLECDDYCNCANTSEVCHKVTGACESGCAKGYHGTDCKQICVPGTFGENCKFICHCKDGAVCDRFYGSCGSTVCADGWHDTQGCQEECSLDYFGYNCTKTCHCFLDSDVCHRTTGYCVSGCGQGYKGDGCQQECMSGTYGVNCIQTCNCMNTSEACDRFNGGCQTGCPLGYGGIDCNKECMSGTYGVNCIQTCNCMNTSEACDRFNGGCQTGCPLGYGGIDCNKECMPGSYGHNCNETCHCKNRIEVCDRINGRCPSGCPLGYVGIDCKMACRDGTFGEKCLQSCHCSGAGNICNKVSGQCSFGCASGYEGDTCQTVVQGQEASEGMPMSAIGGIVGGVVAAILVTGIVIISVIFLRRRKRRLNDNGMNSLVTAHVDNGINNRVTNDYVDSSLVVTIPTTTQVHTPIPTPIELHTQPNNSVAESDDMLYMNSIEMTKSTAIKVEDFPDYVQKRLEDAKLLEGEFKKLPEPQKKGFDVAIKSENIKKNRYQKIFPYDRNRVVLDTVNDDPFSDYINASYINGYVKHKEFIAAQGPVPTIVPDFWRMVWTAKSAKVVMLTNIVESGRKKCELYWEQDGVLDADEIKVKHILTEEYADFCIRTFKLTKEEDGESRIVRQFHFTSWADHDAPDDTTAMLEFLNKIQNTPGDSNGPIIVHCSAGVGRTGTFICLNYLINQAAAEGQIDIVQCTNTMRSQRMYLIQTKAQFAFLHRAVCDAITLQMWPIPATDFMAWYNAEQNTNSDVGIYNNDENDVVTKFKQEYKLLTNLQTARHQKTKESSRRKNKKNSEKNKKPTTPPADEYRVFLSTATDGTTNYIDSAVCISSYVKRSAYIATELPLDGAVIDFWRLVYERRCQTVVVLCDEHEISSRVENYSEYWPEKEKNVFGPFSVHKTSQNNSGPCLVREFSFTYENLPSLIPQTVKQFSLLGWPANKKTPGSPKDILSLCEMVEDWQRQTSNGSIVVQCMDGAFKCGLYCASSIIIERLREDQTVSVLSTVKQLKAIRPRFINSMEQYQFCYDVAKAYLDSFSDYYNFK